VNWNASIRTLLLAALSVSGCWAFWRIGLAADAAEASISQLIQNISTVTGRMSTTLDAINAPCAGFHGSVTCGPLAQLSQTEKNVGILAGKSAQQVQQTGVLVTAVAHNLDTVGESVKQTASHLNKTADAATGTLDAGTKTIQTANTRLGPLMDAWTAPAVNLDAMIRENSPSVRRVLVSAADFTDNASGISGDLRKVADKESYDYLKPVPWWEWPIKRAGQVWDITAAVARHVP